MSTTASAPLKEASRLLLDVASTPPMSGGEWRTRLIHARNPPTRALSCVLQQPRDRRGVSHSIRVFRSLTLGLADAI